MTFICVKISKKWNSHVCLSYNCSIQKCMRVLIWSVLCQAYRDVKGASWTRAAHTSAGKRTCMVGGPAETPSYLITRYLLFRFIHYPSLTFIHYLLLPSILSLTSLALHNYFLTVYYLRYIPFSS